MAINKTKLTSLVDSTHRINWELTKEKFENCAFPDCIESHTVTIDINGKQSKWYLRMYPKGREEEERNNVIVFLVQRSKQEIFKVIFEAAIKTDDGYWPMDFVKDFYSRGNYDEGNYFGYKDEDDDDDDRDVGRGWDYIMCTTEEFEKYFVENKVTIVASVSIYVEGDKYRKHMQVSDEFVDNIRSISSEENNNLTDFAIISGNKRFPCHRVLLAVRSEYFKALFRNEPTKTEVTMDEAPELVKTMLEFMTEGHIPKDIDDKAMDLILMADKYGLDLLTIACEASLLNNLSPDNAVETLITIDKVKHISKQEHRLKVLAYIKKEGDEVVKSKDWKKFVQNYPDLITEAFLLKCSKKYGTCSS